MPPDPDSFVSRYRLHEKLGEGGMGVVYRATDLSLRRQVALKVLGDTYRARKKFRARFLREARTAAALNHPGICTIHEVGEVPADTHIDVESEPRLIASGTPYLTMEYVQGRTLADRLRKNGPLPLAELLEVAVQVVEALGEAHSHHIVHRDLKPANVMMGPEGRVKILDFGLAKPVDLAADEDEEKQTVSVAETITRNITGEGKVFGTVAYMSPEQALGKSADTRSDIFSFGIMLFELCVGRRPFQGESSTSTVAKILEAEPESAVNARPALPQQMDRILRRCLQKKPEDRYTTEDLALALRELRDAGGTEGRRRLPLSAIAVAGVLAITMLLLFMTRDITVPPAPPTAAGAIVPTTNVIAVLPFTVQGSPEFAYLGDGLVTLLSTTLDGAGELRSVDARAVLGCIAREAGYTPSAENGVSIAGKLGAGRFVLGDVVEAGGRLRIRADLYDAGEPSTSVGQATVEGTADDLFSLVDDLTGRLLAAQLGDPGARVARIAAVTTESVPALKAYLEGESELRAGRFAEALAAFESAVSQDEEFALAYYRMSIAAEWLTRAELTQTAAQQAFHHSARLSEHDRSLLEAYLAWHQGDGNRAEALYRAIVDSYPDDVEAWFQLGEVLFHYGPPQGRSIIESKPAWDRVLEFEDEHALALMHLARIAALEKRFPEMRTLIDKILALNPASERRLPFLALRAFVDGDTAAATRVKDELRGMNTQIVSQAAWEVAVFGGDYNAAVEIYDVLAGPGRSRATRTLAMGMQAYMDATRGRFDDAWERLRQARRLDPVAALEYHALLATMPHVQVDRSELRALLLEVEAWDAGNSPRSPTQDLSTSVHNDVHPFLRSFLLGLLHACLGQPEKGLPYAVELETREGSERARRLGQNLAVGLRGRIAWEQGDRETALSILESGHMNQNYIFVLSSPFFSLSQQRYLRGQALEESGLHEEALAWFSSFEGYSVYDLVHIGPALVEQARILEAHGRRPEAAARYRRFLELWEGCDGSLQPQVEAARARLAALSDS